MAQGPRYWHVLPLTMIRTLLPEFQKMKWSHLSPWATNKRNKDAFFSSTYKVLESKVCLFLSFIAQGPRYWHFLPLTMVRTPLPELQKIKWPYLVSWAKNQKSKATFFSSTFKVWEGKVPLVLWFVGQELRYRHFLIYHLYHIAVSL